MNLTKKSFLLIIAIICILTVVVLSVIWLCFSSTKLEVTLESFKNNLFEHPADIIEFQGSFWTTELLSNRVVETDLSLSKTARSVSHPNVKKHFSSPHYLATDNSSLFFSGGWGRSIYAFDSTFTKFQEFTHSKDTDLLKLNAPHGICRHKNWLYVADSLNSRLIRIDITTPEKVETFADYDQLIAYGRQILCEKDGIWLSNSYEKREGLNQGQGSNVLKITDFDSGKAEIITQFPNTNITGIYLHQQRYLITAQWHTNSISIFDTKRKEHMGYLDLPQPYVGVPYGMFFSNTTNRLYITFIGDIYGKQNKGGVAVYKISKKALR